MIRPEVAALLRAGHTNDHIARRVGISAVAVGKARRALGLPPAHVLRRLLAEGASSGALAGPPRQPPRPVSREEGAANLAALAVGIAGYRTGQPRRRPRPGAVSSVDGRAA